MTFALRTAWATLRARPGRAALTAAGIASAALVLGVTITVAHALSTGFSRAADRADLPTVVARFGDRSRADLESRVRALPNLAAASYRLERTDVGLSAGEHRLDRGVVHVVLGGRRGYAIVAGTDIGRRDGVVVEQGLAREWHLRPGDAIEVAGIGRERIAGVALSPDNVAYPLTRTARIYISQAALLRRLGAPPEQRLAANVALLWARDPSRADVLVSAARQSSFGLRSLRFLTRSGIQALIGQAAGIIVALLVAFAAVAAGLAGVLLAAGAQSEVQRALERIGVERALGATPRTVVAVHATRAALVAAPAAALGLAAGGVAARAPVGDVLASLNELAPGGGTTAALLLALWIAVTVLVAACAAVPAWRAARRAPAALLRGGGDLAPRAGRGGSGSLAALGARLVTARRARFGAIVAVLGAATGVVLLLLALGSLLQALRDDPATLGKRYQLTTPLDPELAPSVAAIRGVEAAAPRFSVPATSGAALGSPLQLVAYPGDHTRFEAPALADGRRLAGAGEAEVGAGLADALGLRPGSTLAVQTGVSRELRFRVVGVVRALQDEGRVAYVRPDRLDDAGVPLSGPIAIRLRPGADRAAVRAGLRRLGAVANPVRGATGDDAGFLGVLAALLRVVALAVALVCLMSLVQALALTARERRGVVATLRAGGADARALARLLGGAAGVVAAPALVVAVALEALLLAPLVSRLAAGYADLPLGASRGQVALVGGGLCALAATAAWLTGRRLVREPVIAGLREET